MKKYIESLIWKPFVITAAVLIVICLFALLVLPPLGPILGVLVVLVLLTAYFGLNRHCQNLTKKYAPTSYFQDLGWRNTDGIVVGSTRVWECMDFSEVPYYNATGFRRSNAMCFNMLKTYFSHVRPGGTVYYVVDPEESTSIGSYISPCDFLHIHPHVFLTLEQQTSPKKRVNPLVYDRSYSLKFAIHDKLKRMGIYKNATWSVKGENAGADSGLMQELCRVVRFCQERDLKCRMIFLSAQDAYASALETAAKQSGCDFACLSAASGKQLREAIR